MPGRSVTSAWSGAAHMEALVSLRTWGRSEPPRSLIASPEWASAFLEMIAHSWPSHGPCSSVLFCLFSSLATLSIHQGEALCHLPCMHRPCAMLVRLVVLVSGDLHWPHSADGRMRKWSFTQMCYNKRIPGKRVYMETKLESDYSHRKSFLFCFVFLPQIVLCIFFWIVLSWGF